MSAIQDNYKEIATVIDNYVKKHGTKEFKTVSEIKEILLSNNITINTMFQPSDLCYNRTTKNDVSGFANSIHLFEYVGRNQYRILGQGYPYSGFIECKPKAEKERIVIGEWKNGICMIFGNNEPDETFFSDILEKAGIEAKDVMIIRHSLSNPNCKECFDSGMIYEYTCHQRKSFYAKNDYWAVFLSENGTLARFYALYKYKGIVGTDTPDKVPVGLPKAEKDSYKGQYYVYDLEKSDLLADYENSLVVDWVNPASWFQSGLFDKKIVSLNTEKLSEDYNEIRDAEIDGVCTQDYPEQFRTDTGITTETWCNLLKNEAIFKEKDLTFIRNIYCSREHANTCYDIGLQEGVSPSTFIKPVVALARRISEQENLKPIFRDNGKRVWWRILFWGRRRKDGHFEWKIQPELAEAIGIVFPDWEIKAAEEYLEREEDSFFSNLSMKENSFSKDYSPEPEEKPEQIVLNGRITFSRNRQKAIHALQLANYYCEIDALHPTFIRKNSDKPYTEPHHLIPMAFQDRFDVSLDVEANIVSLCSNCHNQIHYGEGIKDLLKILYDQRREMLEEAGIIISFEELLSMYGEVG